MSQSKSNVPPKRRFTKANVFKVMVFYIAFYVIFYALDAISSARFMQLFTISKGGADFSFNDIYYRVVASEHFEGEPHFRTPKSVVLINTGSLNRDYFRVELANLLLRLEEYQPKVMAVDHEFSKDTAGRVGTSELLAAAEYYGDILFAYDSRETSMMRLQQEASVALPTQHVIRYYYGHDSAFAFRIAQRLSSEVKPAAARHDSFPIHYCSYNKGFSDWRDDMNPLYDINFKAVEATEFIEPDSLTKVRLRELIQGKALIIGHLGSREMNNEFDIEDRFRVPVDPLAMTGRERLMPGPVIHANVAENYLHPEHLFWELKGWLFIFLQQLAYIGFLVFVLFNNIRGIIKKLVLGILSIISLFLVIQLMHVGIYISMGVTLLQLLVIEETSRLFEPYYKKLEKYLKIGNDETNQTS